MNAQEKSKELVEKYKIFVLCQSPRGEYDPFFEIQNAKQCARIAVEEMIKEIRDIEFNHDLNLQHPLDYWASIKKEIDYL